MMYFESCNDIGLSILSLIINDLTPLSTSCKNSFSLLAIQIYVRYCAFRPGMLADREPDTTQRSRSAALNVFTNKLLCNLSS